jgi:hypothetical protein
MPRAATEGMTRATMSEATPTARKSHPAVSVAPSERAYQPFCVMPTAARASAAAMRIIEAADRRDNNRDAVTGANVTVGGGSGIGPDLFRKACEFGLEGLVSKRADRPYRGGRCNHWIKVKNRNSPAMQRADEIEWR